MKNFRILLGGAGSMLTRLPLWVGLFSILFSILSPSLSLARTLTVWAMGEEGQKISILARKFEEENPGVTVVTQAIPWDAAHEKLLMAVVGKLPPDVSQLGTTWMAEFATLNALQPLEDLIDQSASVKQSEFFEGSWKTGLVNGRTYGIPWYVDTRVLFYRKDLLEKVGFRKPPQTWDELKEVSRRLTQDSNSDGQIDRYGIDLPIRDWGSLLYFVWQNEGNVFEPSDPKFKEAVDFYISFFKEKLVPASRLQDTDLFQSFKTGFFSMFISGPWMVELIQKELPELEGKWEVSMLPGNKKRTSFVGGCNLVLFKDSKEKEMGWKFIEFLSRPDIQLEWFKIMKSLPAVAQAWEDPSLNKLKVFGEQLKDTNSPPAVPEWEQIADRINTRMEKMILKPEDGSVNQNLVSLEKELQDLISKPSAHPKGVKRFLPELFFAGLLALLIAGFLRTRRKISIKKKEDFFRWSPLHSMGGYFFILPAVVILMLFLFVPILLSFIISLTDWNIYGLADRVAVRYIGFQNYIKVFQDALFWKSLRNTLVFTGVGVPFTIMISLFFATLLNEKFIKFKSFFRTAYFIPVISTIVAVAVIWRWLYNPEYGLLNFILKSFQGQPLNWLGDPRTALASLILMAAWKNFGYNMVIFLAALQNIPETLYESARIDGANAWQLFWNITLPGLRTTMIFVFLMSTIGYLQMFAEPYVMTKGGPLNSTLSVVLYMYNQGFKFFELGYASALSYILFGVILMATFIQIQLQKTSLQAD